MLESTRYNFTLVKMNTTEDNRLCGDYIVCLHPDSAWLGEIWANQIEKNRPQKPDLVMICQSELIWAIFLYLKKVSLLLWTCASTCVSILGVLTLTSTILFLGSFIPWVAWIFYALFKGWLSIIFRVGNLLFYSITSIVYGII